MNTQEKKQIVLDQVYDIVKKRVNPSQFEEACRFIQAFYISAIPEEINITAPEKLFAIAYSMWKLADKRRPDTTRVKVFNPTERHHGWTSKYTVIQIINDDMPFLVDSITGHLSVIAKHSIKVMHHPLLFVERDKAGTRIETLGRSDYDDGKNERAKCESCIYIEIDRQKDAEAMGKIKDTLMSILSDVRLCVKDWKPILTQMIKARKQLGSSKAPIGHDRLSESCKMMDWLMEDNFTFLGYREYRFKGNPKTANFRAVPKSGLGLLRDKNRYVLRDGAGSVAVSGEIRDYLAQKEPLYITKANIKTTVHRPVHLDYIGIKIYDKDGNTIGEKRFVGLFTSQSYGVRTKEVPLLRFKVGNVQRKAMFGPATHAGKALSHILETFPRDELYQTPEDDLLEFSLGILHLQERPQPKAFVRPDKYERYVVALVYVPRENYHSALREKVADILCKAFNGEVSVYHAMLTEDVLARWHFIIRTRPGHVPKVDLDELNIHVRQAAKTWSQHLKDSLVQRHGEYDGTNLHEKYDAVFSAGFREAFAPHQAASDVERLENLNKGKEIDFECYRLLVDDHKALRLKIYHASQVVPLSDCLPLLENMGLRVISEHSYELDGGADGCIHDFYLENAYDGDIDVSAVKNLVEDLLAKVWSNEIENDGLNALTIQAGFPANKIVVLRAYTKYLRQLGMPYSMELVEDCLVKHAELAEKLFAIFEIKFDPKLGTKRERVTDANILDDEIREKLESISSLDEDRILRALLGAILATLRTNYYRAMYKTGPRDGGVRPGLAFKIRSSKFHEVPKPRPFAEIWVYSPRVEGVHIRFGPVARGGLRWSDRREDFRTEVLGLVKAQQVKNAVIVPVGAKGGFYPKNLPTTGGREAFMAEGIACYKMFIQSLLSVTDNLKDNKVVPPNRVVRWDGSDPYLVVAADKGTATFSDIANGLAQANGFWLDDAFASGGSVGYDHKKMGITAKGAWVSVQRHFREMGIDVQKDSISIIGVGDMSGDVFGNGLLLSKTVKLICAFDHRHIFFDPEPDPAISYKERLRLFKLPRSSWEDYNVKLISEGGGIYPRSAKSIPLNKEFRKFLGVEVKQMAPLEVLKAILKTNVDLLWFGGIGTYVKATAESNGQVGDKANDALRVNAKDLNVKVIGEGGNLGMTQRGRIEFARNGGYLNTDFIDNSAGVDCSDKEVNIKILVADCVVRGSLKANKREKFLASMTTNVSEIVLQDNYLQTQAISLAEAQAVKERELHLGLIRVLEREERLDREIEFLPTDEQFSELALNNEGLTRPELSVLISYAKMSLYEILLASKLLDQDLWDESLSYSFPKALKKRFFKEMKSHALKKEIIATTLANEVVNRAGLTFMYEVKEETGLALEQIVAAYIIVREAFSLNEVWPEIDAQDYKVSSSIQTLMHIDISHFVRHQSTWFLRNMPRPLDLFGLINQYKKGLNKLVSNPQVILSPLEMKSFDEKFAMYVEMACRKNWRKKLLDWKAWDRPVISLA
jgi:glutamate dehydrogenase